VDDAHDGPYAREPQIEDLIRLAQALNEHGVRYVLIGGFAVIAHGGARTTKDIDLLIDAGPENVARVRSALQILEDKAVNDVADDDLTRYYGRQATRRSHASYSRSNRARSSGNGPCSACARRAANGSSPTARRPSSTDGQLGVKLEVLRAVAERSSDPRLMRGGMTISTWSMCAGQRASPSVAYRRRTRWMCSIC
jgi:predicted nucleotidyltransferase